MSEEKELDHSSQFALDSARKEGLRVVVPGVNQIQIDIDNDADYSQFTQVYKSLSNLAGYYIRSSHEEPSRNGGEGRHITITFDEDLSPMERIALQAIFGSDWRRELFSIIRLKEGQAIPTLFFEKP